MSDKPNLAQDLEEASEAADNAVLRMLKQEAADDDPNGTLSKNPKAAAPNRRNKKTRADTPGQPNRRTNLTAARRGKSASPKSAIWSRPTALFNTRIPSEMAELLDDLLYRLRRERRESGVAVTKQALAQEAFEDLLRKYGLIS